MVQDQVLAALMQRPDMVGDLDTDALRAALWRHLPPLTGKYTMHDH